MQSFPVTIICPLEGTSRVYIKGTLSPAQVTGYPNKESPAGNRSMQPRFTHCAHLSLPIFAAFDVRINFANHGTSVLHMQRGPGFLVTFLPDAVEFKCSNRMAGHVIVTKRCKCVFQIGGRKNLSSNLSPRTPNPYYTFQEGLGTTHGSSILRGSNTKVSSLVSI